MLVRLKTNMHIKLQKNLLYSKSPLGRIRIKNHPSTLIPYHRWAEMEIMHITHKQCDDSISIKQLC